MITVVTSVTDEKIYQECLGASLKKQKTPFKLIRTNPKLKLTESYLVAVPENPKTKYLLFIHQDFVLCDDYWLKKAEEFCDSLSDLGVAGVAGWNAGYDPKIDVIGYFVAMYGNRKYGKVSYFGKEYVGEIRGKPFDKPVEVQVVDDMCIIIPTKVWNKQKFDSCFSFHLNGQDYSLTVRYNLGLKVYVLPLKFYEVSTTSYSKDYFEQHGHLEEFIPLLKKKWGHKTKWAGEHSLG